MRAEWGFSAAILTILLAAASVLPLPTRGEPGDSFGEEAGGKRAFFLLASQLLKDVRRSSISLLPRDEEADVLVLLGPARYPDRAQWQTLYDWVAGGRALVFAARWQDPSVRLEPFGIEVLPLAGLEEPADSAPARGVVESELVEPDELEWRSRGLVRTTADTASVELWYDGRPQILRQPVGDGVVVVVASDFVFSNRSLTNGHNGVLAFRVLESASPAGPVYFDEALNEAGRPRVVGILLEEPLRLPTLQLAILLLLFGWMASRRFGPVETEELPARRSLVEHAEALGSLHFKVGTAAPLLASYLEFFRRELTAKPSTGTPKGQTTSHSTMVQVAVKEAKNPKLDRDRAVSLLHGLARVRSSRRQG